MAIIRRMSSKATVGKIEKYLKQEEKTEEKLISAINCDSDNFAKQCEMTNLLYNKNQEKGERKYYHIVQSFSPEDNNKLTHEQAHKLGVEFAERNFKGHEVLVVTHKDKDHIHNHFVVNSVSLENGKKYRADNKSLWQMRKYSNEQCKKNGLVNSIQPLDKRAKEKINNAEIRGKESWQGELKKQIIEVSKNATSLDDFRNKIYEKYKVETRLVTHTHKGITKENIEFKPNGNRKFFNAEKRMGTDFGKEYIDELTRRNAEKERGRTSTKPARAEQPRGTITDTTIRDRERKAGELIAESRKQQIENLERKADETIRANQQRRADLERDKRETEQNRNKEQGAGTEREQIKRASNKSSHER